MKVKLDIVRYNVDSKSINNGAYTEIELTLLLLSS